MHRCLEGGAEEFLLKPLQLSDLKNLENYLLKPLIDHSCESKIINIEDDFTQNNVVFNDGGDDNKSNATDGKINGNNSNTNIISKRKAVMSPSPSERRPKVKGLAVV